MKRFGKVNLYKRDLEMGRQAILDNNTVYSNQDRQHTLGLNKRIAGKSWISKNPNGFQDTSGI